MHEALLVVDKMILKERTYVEILTVIWGLSNTAAWKGLKFKQGKSIPNRTLCISTSLKIRRKSSHCQSTVKHCLCFTRKDRKIGSWIYRNLSLRLLFFWAPLQLEIWSIQHSKQLGGVWCLMLLLVIWFLLLFQSRVFHMPMKKLHLARLNYSRRKG